MRTLILAGSFREAAVYARARGLRHYRYAASANAVENFAAQRVVQLPGFARRADKHALISIAKRVERRGGEWVEDEYVPEPVEETPLTKLAAFTRSDWLFGNVAAVKPQSVVEREQSGDAPAPPPASFASEPKKPEPKPAAKPKRTRKTPTPRKTSDSAIPLENKGSGRDSVTVPEATTSVDDLFED